MKIKNKCHSVRRHVCNASFLSPVSTAPSPLVISQIHDFRFGFFAHLI